MKLTDVMSHSGLSGYALIAMILFLIAFVAILVRVFQPSRRQEFDRAGRLPLDDDPPTSHPGASDES